MASVSHIEPLIARGCDPLSLQIVLDTAPNSAALELVLRLMLIKGVLVSDNLNGYIGDVENKLEAYGKELNDELDLLTGEFIQNEEDDNFDEDNWVQGQFESVTGKAVEHIGLLQRPDLKEELVPGHLAGSMHRARALKKNEVKDGIIGGRTWLIEGATPPYVRVKKDNQEYYLRRLPGNELLLYKSAIAKK